MERMRMRTTTTTTMIALCALLLLACPSVSAQSCGNGVTTWIQVSVRSVCNVCSCVCFLVFAKRARE